MKKEVCHTYLGRFSPFHKYHEMIVRRLVESYGAENVLILVGSSNTYNFRTPYTYEDRKMMINTIYPEVEVSPLPDGKPSLVYFDGSTNDIWLDNISRIEKERNTKFVFYGGSEEDLKVLSERFETRVLVDRENEGVGVSATVVREALSDENYEKLSTLVNPKIVPIIKDGFLKFKKFETQNEK